MTEITFFECIDPTEQSLSLFKNPDKKTLKLSLTGINIDLINLKSCDFQFGFNFGKETERLTLFPKNDNEVELFIERDITEKEEESMRLEFSKTTVQIEIATIFDKVKFNMDRCSIASFFLYRSIRVYCFGKLQSL